MARTVLTQAVPAVAAVPGVPDFRGVDSFNIPNGSASGSRAYTLAQTGAPLLVIIAIGDPTEALSSLTTPPSVGGVPMQLLDAQVVGAPQALKVFTYALEGVPNSGTLLVTKNANTHACAVVFGTVTGLTGLLELESATANANAFSAGPATVTSSGGATSLCLGVAATVFDTDLTAVAPQIPKAEERDDSLASAGAYDVRLNVAAQPAGPAVVSSFALAASTRWRCVALCLRTAAPVDPGTPYLPLSVVDQDWAALPGNSAVNGTGWGWYPLHGGAYSDASLVTDAALSISGSALALRNRLLSTYGNGDENVNLNWGGVWPANNGDLDLEFTLRLSSDWAALPSGVGNCKLFFFGDDTAAGEHTNNFIGLHPSDWNSNPGLFLVMGLQTTSVGGFATYHTDKQILPGVAYKIRMLVKANTPGSPNGQLRIWVNGLPVQLNAGVYGPPSATVQTNVRYFYSASQTAVQKTLKYVPTFGSAGLTPVNGITMDIGHVRTFVTPLALGTADVTQLLAATGSPTLLPNYTAYAALDPRTKSHGWSYTDPVGGRLIYKITDALYPVANGGCGTDYSDSGPFTSMPWADGDGYSITIAVAVDNDALGQRWLVDFKFVGTGLGPKNERRLTGLLMESGSPFGQRFCFSYVDPRMAYTVNGGVLRKIDTQLMTVVGTVVSGFGAGGWLQSSYDDDVFVALKTQNNTTIAQAYRVSTGTLMEKTFASMNEPRLDRSGRYVLLASGNAGTVGSPGNQLWDLQTDTIVGGPLIKMFHSAGLHDFLCCLDNDGNKFNRILRCSTQAISSPSLSWYTGDETHESGNWKQPVRLTDPSKQYAASYCLDGGWYVAGDWARNGFGLFRVDGGDNRLLAHLYTPSYTQSTGLPANKRYWGLPFANISQSGHIFTFTSQMAYASGANSAGRYDLFAGIVPRSGGL